MGETRQLLPEILLIQCDSLYFLSLLSVAASIRPLWVVVHNHQIMGRFIQCFVMPAPMLNRWLNHSSLIFMR